MLMKPACPMCNEPICKGNVKPNQGFQSMLDEIHVRCSNRRDGCEWTGRMDARPGHEAICPVTRWKRQVAELEAKIAKLAAAEQFLQRIRPFEAALRWLLVDNLIPLAMLMFAVLVAMCRLAL
eukprot:CAMPEP_0178448466 /NCGR_PEP_ID=MMETSP0689_2-20121128/42005_1 /TAXON_ID=160604 /ORGANISM="Amphidinium massartii, Strain CS-259" /LENGTH=122 /DNA_ID=CAMNT_0020073665 /DNA_START=88 /DNA_END=453 /DNA_ORIENTATION=+